MIERGVSNPVGLRLFFIGFEADLASFGYGSRLSAYEKTSEVDPDPYGSALFLAFGSAGSGLGYEFRWEKMAQEKEKSEERYLLI